ncbi:possible protease sohB [Vibrio astriarenae]|nr:possible protease sohB [Vibrio sp. C7]
MDYGLFLAKIATVVVAIVAILVIAKAVGSKQGGAKGELEVTDLSQAYKQNIEQLEHHLHDEAFIKARDKAEKKAEKEKTKAREKRDQAS